MKKKKYVSPSIDIIKITMCQSLMYSKQEQPVLDPSDPNTGMSKRNNFWEDESKDNGQSTDIWNDDE